MKYHSNATQGQTTLGASLLAFVLSLSSSAAHANNNRADDRINAFNAREAIRTERREARMERREARIQQNFAEQPTSIVPPQSVGSVSNVQFARHNGARHNGGRANTSAQSNAEVRRAAREAQLPGQVSTFQTSRPTLGRSTFETDRGNSKLINRGVSLDLSSTNANITLGENLFNGTVTLIIGGEEKQFSAGSNVTAAEYAALNQKIATGSQSLTLSSSGAASGGNLNLNLVSENGLTIRASELVVPQNVTVAGDFGRAADGVRVTNDLVNYGSIVASSTNSNKNIAVIGARDITNSQGGSIASVSTASNPNLNLALRADRDLNNAGSIQSAGDLELTAGNSITNSSGAVAGAAGTVSLNSSAINNQGLVSAQNDITLSGASDVTLAVNNSGGTMSAVNGSINLRESGFTGTGNSIIYGGDLLSKHLNINAGQATGDVIANDVTGAINSSGLAAHVSVDTDTLVIGTQCLTGDPTYYNTGNIIIGGDITVAEDLTIIAGGSITDTVGVPFTLTAVNGGVGQDITLIAGANITAGSGQIAPAGGPATLIAGAQDALSAVTISGGSTGGGNIAFTNANTIDSRGILGNADGGNITLIAFRGNTSQGTILMPTTTLLASGVGSGNNGKVTVIAERSISLGDIVTNIGTGTGANTGTVVVQVSKPATTDGLPITYATNGSISSGNFWRDGGALVGSGATATVSDISASGEVIIFGESGVTVGNSITAGDLLLVDSSGGPVTFQTGGTYQAIYDISIGGNVSNISGTFTATESIEVYADTNTSFSNATLTAPSVVLLSKDDMNFNQTTVNVSQGLSIIASGNITGNVGDTTTLNGVSGGGDGANITVLAGINWSDQGSYIYLNSASAGSINASAFDVVDTSGFFKGGLVTLVAFGANQGVNVGASISSLGSNDASGNVIVVGNSIVLDSIDATPTYGGGVITLSATDGNYLDVLAVQKDFADYTGSFIGTATGGYNAIEVINATRGGQVTMTAVNSPITTGDINTSGVTPLQGGGSITIVGGNTSLGAISTNGLGLGSAGSVGITALNVSLSSISATGGIFGGAGASVSVIGNSSSSFNLGSLSATGGGATGNGGSFIIRNDGSGGVTFVGADVSSQGAGGVISVDTTQGAVDGPIVITGFSVNANGGVGFDNGSILLNGSEITMSGGSQVAFSAFNGNANTGNISLGATTGDIVMSGGLQAISGGPISIDMNPSQALTTNGSFGIVELVAAGAVTATNVNINTSASLPAAGGNILISGFSVSVRNLTSVGSGSGSGGTVSVSSASGSINVGDINIDGGASGAGGSFTLNTSSPSVNLKSISARGLGTANGGSLTINLNSTGILTFGANSVLNVDAAAAAGSIQILTSTGNVTFQGGTSSLSARGGTADGAISFNQLGNLVLGTTNLTIDNDGGGTSANISLTSTNPSSGISSTGGDLTISASGSILLSGNTSGITTNGGDVSLEANAFVLNGTAQRIPVINTSAGVGPYGDVTIAVNSSLTFNNAITGNDITITMPVSSVLTLNANLTAQGTTTITAGSITQSGSQVVSDALQLNLTASLGVTGLSTDVNSLGVIANSGNLTITNSGAISLVGISGAVYFALDADGVTIDAPLSAAQGITITSVSGDIEINDTVNLGAGAGSIVLQANNGNILESANGSISTNFGGSLNLSVLTNGFNTTLTGVNNIETLNASGRGTVTVDNGANPLTVGSLGNLQSLVATTTNDVSGINLTGTVNTAGTVTLNTPVFSIGANNLTAASITIESTTDLTMTSNGATLTATTPAAGTPGNPSTPTAINFIAGPGADLTLNGTMNMSGDVTFVADGTLTSQNNSLYAGSNNVILDTDNWVQLGNGDITGVNLILSGITIVNPDGNLVLSSNLILNGQDLVLAARNNVVLGNFNIDLSSTTEDGGDLWIIAGYTLTPTGGGQQQTQLPVTVGAPTAGGGSVSGTGLISTGSTAVGGDGGQIVIVTTGPGTISLNNIDTTATAGTGGDTYILGAGITLNNVTTTGSTKAGVVYLGGFDTEVTLDSPPTPLVIQNGKLTGGTFDLAFDNVGPISVNNITAADASVTLNNRGANATVTGTIDAHDLFIYTDGLNFTTANNLTLNPDAVGNGGKLELDISSLTSPTGALFAIHADGTGTGNGGEIEYLSRGVAPTFVGAPVKAPKGDFIAFSVTAESGASGGNGGSIDLVSGGSLTVNTAFLQANPQSSSGDWNGATYGLSSGPAKGAVLLVTGDIHADGVGTGLGGRIVLTSGNKKVFTVNATKTPKNGNFGELTAEGSLGSIVIENYAGGVTVASNFAEAPDIITLISAAKGNIAAASGVVLSADLAIEFVSDLGAIGKKPLVISTPQITVNGEGIVNLQSVFAGQLDMFTPSSAGKSFNLTAIGDLNINQAIEVVGDVNISTSGAINLDTTVTTQSGSIALTAGSGTLDIGGDITANNGGIVLANLNTASGAINIDAVTVKTDGKGDDVIIAIGPPPKKGTNTVAEPGFNVDNQGTKGVAYFGPAGGVVTAGTVDVNVINKDVIFNNLSTGGQLITVASGATITADPPSRSGAGVTVSQMNAVDLSSAADLASAFSSTNFASAANAQSLASAAGSLGLTNAANSFGQVSVATSTSAPSVFNVLAGGGVEQMNLTLQPTLSFSETLSGNAVVSKGKPGTDVYGIDSDLKVDAAFRETAAANDRENGNVVFAPRSDMTVETRHGTVSLKAGSVALVMQSENSLSVYDLHDECRNAVTVRNGNTQLSLTPGRHVTISSHSKAEFVDVNAIELVQYRGVSRKKLQNGHTVYASEFSIPSACYAVKPLARLLNSKHPDARKLTQRLIKTTSVILTLNPDRGDYVQFFKPRVAAMR